MQESCDGTTGGVLDIDVKLFRGEASNLETLGGSVIGLAQDSSSMAGLCYPPSESRAFPDFASRWRCMYSVQRCSVQATLGVMSLESSPMGRAATVASVRYSKPGTVALL